MLILIKVFYLLIWLFFIFSTFMNFGLGDWSHSFTLILLREVLGWSIFFTSFIIFPKLFWTNIKKFIVPITVLFLLSLYAILHSAFGIPNNYNLIAGFKYWIYFLWILLGLVISWSTIVHRLKPEKFNSLMGFVKFFLLFLLVFGFLRQLWKLFFPSFYVELLWYWFFGDFIAWEKPPIYYLTGPDWIPRLSGVFAWPNVLGFFLVLIWIWLISSFKQKKIRIILFWVILALVILTLSRGAFLAFSIQLLILTRYFLKNFKYKIIFTFAILWLFFSFLKFVSFFKTGSNDGHSLWSKSTISYILQKPVFWHGLGSSGPSLHYQNTSTGLAQTNGLDLLENIYLQIIADLWLFGFTMWIFIFLWFAYFCRKIWSKTRDVDLFILSIAFLSLMIEWVFLHVFIDSSVNWIFFSIYWLVLWKNIVDSKSW